MDATLPTMTRIRTWAVQPLRRQSGRVQLGLPAGQHAFVTRYTSPVSSPVLYRPHDRGLPYVGTVCMVRPVPPHTGSVETARHQVRHGHAPDGTDSQSQIQR